MAQVGIGRSLLLTVGPVGLIGLSYVTAAPTSLDWQQIWADLQPAPGQTGLPRLSETPPETYERASAQILYKLPSTWPVVDRYPFLVTGNVSLREMQQALDQVVFPTYRALMIDYFDHPPSQPVTLVLMSDEQSFVDVLGRMGYAGRKEYAGIYSRDDRRLVLNLATGEGTLAHELTHALAHADFLKMPEWFDEGLAALHEESVFTADGRRLIGQPNWRDNLLREAYQRPSRPTLAGMITGSFGSSAPAVDYALARNLCRYLQTRQLLGAFYRKCRARIHDDPTGGLSLLEIAGSGSFAELDTDFRAWFEQNSSGRSVR